MHYCIALITKEFPSDEVIQKKLAPYNWDTCFNKYEEYEKIPKEAWPRFTWDWYVIGGRYGGLIKLKISEENKDVYEWDYYSQQRAGRLFRSHFIEECYRGKVGYHFREEDYFSYMGSNEGYILVDGCKICDMVDFEKTILNYGYALIGKDEEVFSRSWWNGDNIIKDEDYEEKVKRAIADVNDCYLCYIDIHD